MSKDTVSLLLSKVEKLLALAGNNPSREEAEAAMMKAQALLARHGLTMEMLRPADRSVGETDLTGPGRRSLWWQVWIATIVSENFRCRVYTRKHGRLRRIILVGSPTDSKIARRVHELAVRVARHESGRYVRERKRTAHLWDRTRAFELRNDFLRGFLDGLEESFHRNVQETGCELMLVQTPEVREYMEGLGLVSGRRSRHVRGGCWEARFAGEEAGRSFSDREQLP